MFIRVFLSVEFCFALKIYLKGAPFYNASAIRYFGLLAPRAKGQTSAGLFVLLRQTKHPRQPRLSWRSSLLKSFGFDPLTDSRGQQMRRIRREWATTTE
jgi:hypothetical protein